VFLFPDPTPRDKMIGAYTGQPMLALTLVTQSLLDEYGVWIKVSSINGGATLYDARPRGDHTYLSVDRHDAKKPSREVVVQHAIPDLHPRLTDAYLLDNDGQRQPLGTARQPFAGVDLEREGLLRAGVGA
jgi:hypothetical protein